jgi:hypothetical protein
VEVAGGEGAVFGELAEEVRHSPTTRDCDKIK